MPIRGIAPLASVTVVALALFHATGRFAVADHVEPRRASRFRADLVTAYEPCTAPNATADESGRAACVPPVRSDPVCGFGRRGSGVVKLAVRGSKLAISVRMRGLDAGCEGAFLNLGMTLQPTTHDCAGAACTVAPLRPSWHGCPVRNGRCALSVLDSNSLIVPAGGRSGVELQRVALVRVPAALTSFTMGILIR
jgi:hypothetical protein